MQTIPNPTALDKTIAGKTVSKPSARLRDKAILTLILLCIPAGLLGAGILAGLLLGPHLMDLANILLRAVISLLVLIYVFARLSRIWSTTARARQRR